MDNQTARNRKLQFGMKKQFLILNSIFFNIYK